MWECVYIYAHKVYLKVKLFLFERENGSFKLFHFPLILFAKSSAKRFIHLCWCSGGSGRSGGHREQGEQRRRVSLLGPGTKVTAGSTTQHLLGKLSATHHKFSNSALLCLPQTLGCSQGGSFVFSTAESHEPLAPHNSATRGCVAEHREGF